MYLRIASVITFVWLGTLGWYYTSYKDLFLRMYPHELGDLLAGWLAPLAAVWVGAAVVLQSQQLKAQRTELSRTEEAIRLQREEFSRSIQELQNKATAARVERLTDRLMFSIQRLARIGDSAELQSATESGVVVRLSAVLGQRGEYFEWAENREYGRTVRTCHLRLQRVLARVNSGQIYAPREIIEEFCGELSSIARLAEELSKEFRQQQPECAAGDDIDFQSLEAFRLSVAELGNVLDTMLHSYDQIEGSVQA